MDIVLEQIVQTIQQYSAQEISFKLGFITGVVHHFICQFPIQKDVSTTLFVWIMENTVFLLALLAPHQEAPLAEMILRLLTFNFINV